MKGENEKIMKRPLATSWESIQGENCFSKII